MRLKNLSLLLEFSVRNIERGINSYEEAARFIQQNPLRKRNQYNYNVAKLPSAETFLVRDEDDGSISVFYHRTAVLTYHEDGAVTINTGGWDTVSTRNLISGYLPRHIRLYRDRNRNWIYIRNSNGVGTPEHEYSKADKHEWTSQQAVITADGQFIQNDSLIGR